VHIRVQELSNNASFISRVSAMNKCIFSLFLLVAGVAAYAADNAPTIAKINAEQWTPVDLEFKTTITWKFSPPDPFAVDFYADIIGPNNVTMKHHGFYDGNNVWKIRFAPPAEGQWTITTRSDVLELDNQRLTVVCAPNKSDKNHGKLLVDPANPRHFIYQDGTKYFPVGYEANWLFALDMDAQGSDLPTLNPFLDKLAGFGFNWININFWAYDTNWRNGKSEEYDFGPPAMIPWEGTNEQPNFQRFHLPYWQHFDKVMKAIDARGLNACLYLKVYNKLVNGPQNNSSENDQYYRYIIARYAAFSHVIWNLAKEAQYEKSTRYKVDRLKFIRAHDPYGRLLTVHDDKLTYDLRHYDGLVDFRSSQEHKDVHATILKQIASHNWPVFMAESGYEHGPLGLKDRTFGQSHTPETVIKNIWNLQMSGVYNAYYYTYTAWDIVRYNDTPPGYTYVKHFAQFFNKTKYWLLKPQDTLVSTGRCLANPGEEYVVYQSEAVPFTADFSALPAAYSATWFQPLSGESIDAGQMKAGVNQLTPPTAWGKNPVVLHVRGK
jgi:Protein of unknown function (DUF4038)/Domain of unknown function (DUF5060)/Putative collagen-binding domain of a collagenase